MFASAAVLAFRRIRCRRICPEPSTGCGMAEREGSLPTAMTWDSKKAIWNDRGQIVGWIDDPEADRRASALWSRIDDEETRRHLREDRDAKERTESSPPAQPGVSSDSDLSGLADAIQSAGASAAFDEKRTQAAMNLTVRDLN